MKRKRTQVTGVVTNRVVCQVPGRKITIEKVDDDGFYILVPLRRGRDLFLYGDLAGDLTLDFHPRNRDECRLATFDEVIALIDGVHANTAARKRSTRPTHNRSARMPRSKKEVIR